MSIAPLPPQLAYLSMSFILLLLCIVHSEEKMASRRIKNMHKWASSANDGAREMEIGLLDGREEGEPMVFALWQYLIYLQYRVIFAIWQCHFTQNTWRIYHETGYDYARTKTSWNVLIILLELHSCTLIANKLRPQPSPNQLQCYMKLAVNVYNNHSLCLVYLNLCKGCIVDCIYWQRAHPVCIINSEWLHLIDMYEGCT